MTSLETESLTALEWVAVLSAAVSGAIHLAVGLPGVPSPLAVSLVLAGLGFAGAIVLVLVGWRRRLVYALGIPFVGLQIVLWFVFNGFPLDPTETVDKVAQAALVLLCLYFLASGRGDPAAP